MKTILVPTDFSDYSNNALRVATHIAKVKGMRIKILHVIEEPNQLLKAVPFLKKENYEQDLIQHESSTREHLDRLVTLEKTNEIKVEYEIRRSKIGAVKEILKEDCDLIVMGRKREDNDEVVFGGTIADKVIRLSSAPVLTIGALKEGFRINKIVFAADFNDESIKPIIQRVVDLANIFHAELHFLYVIINREYLNDDQAAAKTKSILEKFDLGDNTLEVFFAPTQEEGISDYIEQERPDILAMCTHGRTGLAHFFLGSVSENMAEYASLPVLTYNINKKKVSRSAKPLTRDRIVWSERSWKRV